MGNNIDGVYMGYGYVAPAGQGHLGYHTVAAQVGGTLQQLES